MHVTDGQFRVVVPARFESTRLPGKVLLPIAGKPMVQHVWERAVASGAVDTVIATDSVQVAEQAKLFGAKVVMTSASCQSGTDRVAEVLCFTQTLRDEWVVSLLIRRMFIVH